MNFIACAYRVSAKALVVQAGTLLMIREYGYWDLPGGGVEHFETPLEALKREVKEEIGVGLSYISSFPLKTWTLHDKEYDWPLLFLVYSTELQLPSGLLDSDHSSNYKIRFFSKNELASAKLAPYLEAVRTELTEMIQLPKNNEK